MQGKDWLCLTCQTQRVLKGVDLQGSSPQKSQPPVAQRKDSVPVPIPNQTTVQQAAISAKQPITQKTDSSKQQLSSTETKQQTPQNRRGADPGSSSSKSDPPLKTEAPKKDSGLFGLTGPRSQSPSGRSETSAGSGKVLGFGSSFLSSAANLLSSAVQDEPSSRVPTPPALRRGSNGPSNDANSSTTKPGTKSGAQNEQNETTSSSSCVSAMKEDRRGFPKTCPLCKEDLKPNPPNYSVCTQCQDCVCNRCGFNPAPHQTEVRSFNLYSS